MKNLLKRYLPPENCIIRTNFFTNSVTKREKAKICWKINVMNQNKCSGEVNKGSEK